MSIIVSLTSTSARLQVLKYTLLSLCNQSLKPDQIILNVSKEGYLIDEGIKELPEWLVDLAGGGKVFINWVDNTGPYRKLMPVYNEASNDDWVITCDDDVIYGEDWLALLVKTAEEHPDAIVCGRARIPVKTIFGGFQSYLNWKVVPLGSVGYNLLPVGISGVLYRKFLLDDSVMKSQDFKRLAPKQDDLWFNLARQMAGVKVAVSTEADKYVFPIEAPCALSKTNASAKLKSWDSFLGALWSRFVLKLKAYLGCSACNNDIAIKKLEKYRRKLG
ncbi:glycosyltransferase [Oceanisphaera psychrotolerans]|uniref:glycosyltransferase n=1 Tax=Oceanisphaera psychrotolerans TaxID=1414654 RepID=UPI0009F6CC3B|nr:glycosyltransferase [Oceanisphaera psychrotolerans]